jgi:hypothetical protein
LLFPERETTVKRPNAFPLRSIIIFPGHVGWILFGQHQQSIAVNLCLAGTTRIEAYAFLN